MVWLSRKRGTGTTSFNTRLFSLLTILMVFSFDIFVDCSGGKDKITGFKTLLDGDTKSISALTNFINEFPLTHEQLNSPGRSDLIVNVNKSPLAVIEKKDTNLGLDFDGIGQDPIFPCAFFGDYNIFFVKSWTAPLSGLNLIQNVMNLDSKMKDVRFQLESELIDSANSMSWVSDHKSITNFVMIVCTSIVQLSYLISRLNSTPHISEEISTKIRSTVQAHLKSLSDFCAQIKKHSGKFGITFIENSEIETSIYFRQLIVLRSDSKLAAISDEMFEVFVDFLFESFGESNCEEMVEIFVSKTRSDFWIPLPIEYLRDRMYYDNKDCLMGFIHSWGLMAFGGPVFDSRHLINLGLLMQQGLVSCQMLSYAMDLALSNGHKAQYNLSIEMIKFLTFTASTPWLLPDDVEAARLIGNFSNPLFEFQQEKLSDNDKVAKIEEIWRFFVNGDEFLSMENGDYKNLCALINTLDKVFPGIYQKLWSLFGDLETEGNGLKFVSDLSSKINQFIENFDDITWPRKFEFLSNDLVISETLEDLRMNSDLSFQLIGCITDILSQGAEELSEAFDNDVDHPNEIEIKQSLDAAVDFIDIFLSKYATKTVIDYWYSKYDYHPTKLINVLMDLWESNHVTLLNLTDSSINLNITKLIDNNLTFSRLFIINQMSKTMRSGIPAFSARVATPKCLIDSGEADSLNYDLLRTHLQVAALKNPPVLSDVFFYSLSELLTLEEISFENALRLFTELEENRHGLVIKTSLEGFSVFWSPSFMITVFKREQNNFGVIIDLFKKYLKFIGGNDTFVLTDYMIKHSSTFTGFIREFRVEIVPDNSTLCFPADFLDKLELKPDASRQDMQYLSLTMMSIFYFSVVKGGISIKHAASIYEKLFQISKTFLEIQFDSESEAFVNFIYSFNCLFLAISRVPNLKIRDEIKHVLHFYEFYRKIFIYVPEAYENLIYSLVTKSATLIALYRKMISNNEPIPATAFSTGILKDRSMIAQIQSSYIGMIGDDYSRFYPTNLGPILEWIKNEQISFDVIFKLVNSVGSDFPISRFWNFIAVLFRILKCPSYSEQQKLQVLDTVFSKDNDKLVAKLCNYRTSLVHDAFIELSNIKESRAFTEFMKKSKQRSWYKGLEIELKRFGQRRLIDSSIKSSNLTVKSEALNSVLNDLISSGSSDYTIRRSVVFDIDEFMAKDAEVLPLLEVNGFSSNPLEDCHIYFTYLHMNIADEPSCFFKMAPAPESFLGMLRAHSTILKKSSRKKLLLGWLMLSVRASNIRVSFLNMLPHLITIDSFVLSSESIRTISKWHEQGPLKTSVKVSNFQEFICAIAEKVFEVILAAPVGDEAPVFDEMLKVFCEILSSDSIAVLQSESIHNGIVDKILQLERAGHSEIVDKSQFLMVYLNLSTDICMNDHVFLNKTIDFLKQKAILYVKFKNEWNTIWKLASQMLPLKFGNSPLSIYLNFGSTQFSAWEPLLDFLPDANLPPKVLISIFINIISDQNFVFENINILLLLPDTFEMNDFDSYNQADYVLQYVVKTINYLESKEAEFKYQCEIGNGKYDLDSVISSELTAKLFMKWLALAEFDTRTGRKCGWLWNDVLGLLRYSAQMEENEEIFLDAFVEMYPDFLEKILLESGHVLKFIFGIKEIIERNSVAKHEALIRKSIALYDKITSTRSQVYNADFLAVITKLKSLLSQIRQVPANLRLAESKGVLQVFKMLNVLALPEERHDELAGCIISYCFAVLEIVFENSHFELNEVKDFSNVLTEILVTLLRRGNLISLANTIRLVDIEVFAKLVTGSVDLHSECSEVLDMMMKIAPIEVADCFYEQIYEKTIRADVCIISKEIISQYQMVVATGFEYIQEEAWSLLYLDALIAVPVDVSIDPKHFEIISVLLIVQFKNGVSLDLSGLFGKLKDLVLKRGTSIAEHVFKFIRGFIEPENGREADKDQVDCTGLYANFFTDELVTNFLTLSPAIFLNYLNILRKKSEKAYENWIGRVLKAQTRKMLKIAIETESKKNSMSIHTTVAKSMIDTLQSMKESTDYSDTLTNILKRYKALEIQSISEEVLNELSNIFVTILFEIRESISNLTVLKEAIKLILTFNPAIDEHLLILIEEVFDDEIFVNLIKISTSFESFDAVLKNFKAKLNITNLKMIKKQIIKFELWDDMNILMDASRNSESSQVIEFFQITKSIPLESKLKLLNNAKLLGNETILSNETILGNEKHSRTPKSSSNSDKINSLLNYFKSLLGNLTADKATIKVIIRAILENPTLMSQFHLPTDGKIRQSLLDTIKKYLNFKSARELIELCENKIGKMVLKLYFRASTSIEPIVEEGLDSAVLVGFFHSFAKDALSNPLHSAPIKIHLIIKSFKVGEELERLYEEVHLNEATLNELTVSLAALLLPAIPTVPPPRPATVYSIYRMTRRASCEAKRNLIVRRLILSYPRPNLKCVDALLQAQLHSEYVDWNLHKDLMAKSKDFPQIQAMLSDFESKYEDH